MDKLRVLRNNRVFTLLTIFSVIGIFFIIPDVSATEALKEDNKHVRTWNKFASDTLALHKKLTAGKNITVKNKTGGYAHSKDFYLEKSYYNNNRLISKVQWEKDNPEQLHTIDVYIHDATGRVIRDFSAAYLPFYHNAPTQTLISFHHYNGQLHAFRSFDASGDRIIEGCSGKDKKGQKINFILDEDELYEESDGFMLSAEYKQCFDGLTQDKPGKYIIPQ
ncbi:MAG: hypothetical protein OEW97_01375 [Gammaproteobacteria bacterium]|nr:hypothetical protein [Gammaproteobacteria bacterium]